MQRIVTIIGAFVLLGAIGDGYAGSPVSWQAFCRLDAEQAKPCRITDSVTSDLEHHMIFTAGEAEIRFSGKNSGAWWSGELNSRPAMGYEGHRGHTVFSTIDLKTSFEWCDKASDGGNGSMPSCL